MIIRNNQNGYGNDGLTSAIVTAEPLVKWDGRIEEWWFIDESVNHNYWKLVYDRTTRPVKTSTGAKFDRFGWLFQSLEPNYLAVGTRSPYYDYMFDIEEISYTFDCWLRFHLNNSAIYADATHIFGFYTDEYTYNTCYLTYDGTTVTLNYGISVGGGGEWLNLNTDITAYVNNSTYINIRVTRNSFGMSSSAFKLYINGEEMDTGVLIADLPAQTAPLFIGIRYVTTNAVAAFYCDDFRFSRGIARNGMSEFTTPNRGF